MEQWLKTEVVKVHEASRNIDVKAKHDVKASSLRPGNDLMLQALLGPASALQACSSNGGEIMVGAEFGVEQQDEALAFLRSVDSELARLLDLHSDRCHTNKGVASSTVACGSIPSSPCGYQSARRGMFACVLEQGPMCSCSCTGVSFVARGGGVLVCVAVGYVRGRSGRSAL